MVARVNGPRLAGARAEAGLTAEQLGELVGKSGWAVRSYERGLHAPRAVTLGRIAEALGREVGYFLEESEAPSGSDPRHGHPQVTPDELELLRILRQWRDGEQR